MKHKRHQKDRRDKDDRYRLDDHRYFKPESHSVKHKVQQHYIMRDLSNNSGDENEPKKLIIYIVNIVLSPSTSHPVIKYCKSFKDPNFFIQPIFSLCIF